MAREASVNLYCEFAFASETCQNMDIEWNIIPPDRQQDYKLIILFSGSLLYNNLYDPLKGRLHCIKHH